MIEKPVAFFSEGSKLQGTLYLPESASPDRPHPAVVVNSGYQGFNEFYPRMFAQKLTEYGYICLGFDYRGMADSEGQPGRVLIEEQVQDVRNAVTFIQTQDGVDAGRIGLLGWGMGAANVVIAAERAKSVSAVAALNGFYDGERWLKSIHSYERWNAILDEVNADRTHRVLEGNSQLADTFVHYPLDVQTRDYVEAELASLYGFGRQTRLQFTESIIDLKAERAAANLTSVPIFVAHGVRNLLHPYSEAEALYEAAAAPKTLLEIDGKHNDFMFLDHPVFTDLCAQLHQFFGDALPQGSSRMHAAGVKSRVVV